jgi:GWxTD domain-containing protein
MHVDFDYARFVGNDSLVYVEVYYSIPENRITYKHSNGRILGGVNMDVWVTRGSERVVDRSWTVPHQVADTAQLALGRNLAGVTAFGVTPGDYTCFLRASDFLDSTRVETRTLALQVVGFPSNIEALSDLELSTSIRQIEPDKDNVFYKNTLEVIPNAPGVYGSAVPTLFYYVEAYNLKRAGLSRYNTRTLVKDGSGNEVFRQEREKERTSSSSVEVGSVSLRKLDGGTYTLVFQLYDSTRPSITSVSKKFFVYKPSAQTQAASRRSAGDFLGSEFGIMTEEELDQDFAYAQYVASRSDVANYEELSSVRDERQRLDSKRAFLYRFWQSRDADTLTASNEFRQEYQRRVKQANEKFSHMNRPGWKTDRGRVYIVYGPPEDIERFPNEQDRMPYEIWSYYSLEGGVIFAFVDRTGFGDLFLAHSTYRSEIHDEDWLRYVQK